MDTYDIRYDNLLRLLKETGLKTQANFATRAGVAQPHISQIINKRRRLGYEAARRIEAAFGLTPGCLDMPTEKKGKGNRAQIEIVRAASGYEIPVMEWSDRLPPDPRAPYGGTRVHTGAIVGPHAYALRMHSDDAYDYRAGSGIPVGAYVIIDPDLPMQDTNIIVMRLDTGAVLRQIVSSAGLRYLKPLNPQYPMSELPATAVYCGAAVRWEFWQDLPVRGARKQRGSTE